MLKNSFSNWIISKNKVFSLQRCVSEFTAWFSFSAINNIKNLRDSNISSSDSNVRGSIKYNGGRKSRTGNFKGSF